jgi:protein-S-isoprenylcysteine O-methyltransferase Ste14
MRLEAGRMISHPIYASIAVWGVWLLAWTAAGLWSRRTQARAPTAFQIGNGLMTALAFGMLFTGTGRILRAGPAWIRLWDLPEAIDWLLFGVVLAGFLFAWWARFALGSLWSASVTIKEGHSVVQSGPYALVRHPIYTGMLFAAYALAAQGAAPDALAGAALLHLTFWRKARVEEGLLESQLGVEAYQAYRRRTPMLIPFLKAPN